MKIYNEVIAHIANKTNNKRMEKLGVKVNYAEF